MPSFPIKENGPLFIIDKVAHSSMQMQQGMLKLIGDVTRIDFQNHTLLESKFKEAKINNQTPISISDSIISMGGVAPIELLLQFSEKYDGYVYLDDAHGTSIYGKNGCGYTLDILNNNPHPRMIITPSLSKGFGSNCAVLAVPTAKDNEYVRRFCAPYIFSNPPVMASINSSIESAKIHLTDEINFLQKKLWDNVALFDAHIQTGAINLNSKIPIKGIFIGDEKKAIKIALFLKENGFFVTAAMYPTVAKGKSILRIALSASHTESDIVALCNLINSALSEKLS
jgi:7-keto-8-aminopelargonate synthetase-like enzyme